MPTRPTPRNQVQRALEQRTRDVPVWALIGQLFIGLGWVRAAVEKLIDPTWWTGEALRSFLVDHEAATIGWYRPFVALVVEPYAIAVAAVVLVAQASIGLLFLSGKKLPFVLAIGISLNLHFLAAGAVDPSAFYLVIQGGLALWLAERAPSTYERGLQVAAMIAAILVGLSLPFASTVHPELVIDDPAMMFVTLGGLTAAACELILRRQIGGR